MCGFSYCSDFFYEGQAGVSFPGLFASMARAYLNEFDATEEDLASVAVKNHENGFLNPKAHFRKKITIDDVMNSPVVASPLKLYDCCPFSDGASSVILCNEKFAKEHSNVFMQALDFTEDTTEHPLEFHNVYRQYLNKFEGMIEDFILKVKLKIISWCQYIYCFI